MDKTKLENVLKANFGFEKFRAPQDEIISSIVDGQDTLAIMPTGGGKSLCYQLPALILDGVTLVISPLIALMKDQVDALRARGISAAMINSSQTAQQQRDTLEDLRLGNLKLAYVAPERFRAPSFIRTLRNIKISLFAVDEAHCISQWGHDFRPDYMRLGEALEILGHPPCAAFTATATPDVKDDILAQLKMRTPKIFVSGFARPNLSFNVRQIERKAEKYMRVCDLIEKYHTGIIYCATRKSAEAISEELTGDHIDHVLYHGGMTPVQRDQAQEIFMNGTKSVAVATNAFGMGIDRSDIRFVCHYELTGSVESFYQEAGRAGRDGLPSYCEMLFMYADKRVQEFFIDGANPTPQVIKGVYRIIRQNSDNSYECFMPIENITEELADILKFESPVETSARFKGWKRKSSSAASNSMAVSSAISILRSLGFIERFDVAGKRTRGTRLLQPDLDESALPINIDTLAQKRNRDESKLKDVLRFAYAKECRQEWILRYFGEPISTQCGCCDNCRNGHAQPLLELSTSQVQEVRKALSGIARMSRRVSSTYWEPRFGREKIIKCLLGSKDERLSISGANQLSTYGILKNHNKKFVSDLFDALVNSALVEIVDGDYPLAGLTERGAKVMLGSSPCPPLDYPEDDSKSSTSNPLNPDAPKKAKRLSTDKLANDLPDEDKELFAMLVAKRNLLRRSMNNIAAFKIFPNLVLQQLAHLRPTTRESAMQIKGIGEVKAEKFLPPFLEIIISYSKDSNP